MKTPRILLLLLLLCSVGQLAAQPTAERLAYIQQSAVIVSNVEPTNEDYADLAPLKQSLRDIVVVGLGEQSHHDGNTFKAKTRLIKFLHQEMGFSVIAFESGFYDCYKAWQEIQQGKTAIDAARKSIYPFWISTETEELFSYIDKQKNTSKPLVFAGIDCKFSGAYSNENLIPDLQKYLLSINSDIISDTAKWNDFSVSLKHVIKISDYFTKPTSADTLILNSSLKNLLTEIKGRPASSVDDAQAHAFWQQFCRSTLAELTKEFTKEQVRDRQMGANLIYLQQELYKGKKVIVWAASSHLTYNGTNIARAFYQNNLRLGDCIKREYGDKYYNIGFTGHKGKIGKLLFFHLINVKKHQSNSIEYVLGQTKQPFLFLDFNKPNLPQWLQEPVTARPFGYRQMQMKLPLVMDGLFYTEEIFGNHFLPPAVAPEQK
ncbi:erythromycin esterase family protein [Hymenobacter actinosclerus]|uniref:Erythromycin esterase n=1 Tax=Hymenobacter actinosclerus TaxID=82805 RepID=A0A1H9ZH84_9BACT|nr:erythromycin esterase family protein [Hymenobacter actinosclerus]SES81004.1 erythromycin esterase [Hymenobacter actinosclerus]